MNKDIKKELEDKIDRINKIIEDLKFAKLAMCPKHNLDEPNEFVPCECEIYRNIEDKAWNELFDEIGRK